MDTHLKELIDLLERCAGPDRELDVEIQETVVGLEMYESIAERGGGKCIRYYPGPPGPTYRALPRYTSSIDAAMTLVPEGWSRHLSEDDKNIWWVDLRRRHVTSYDDVIITKNQSLAIALCLASLKAQLSTRTNEQNDARNLSGVPSE